VYATANMEPEPALTIISLRLIEIAKDGDKLTSNNQKYEMITRIMLERIPL
jgi:hypothetical protein